MIAIASYIYLSVLKNPFKFSNIDLYKSDAVNFVMDKQNNNVEKLKKQMIELNMWGIWNEICRYYL